MVEVTSGVIRTVGASSFGAPYSYMENPITCSVGMRARRVTSWGVHISYTAAPQAMIYAPPIAGNGNNKYMAY